LGFREITCLRFIEITWLRLGVEKLPAWGSEKSPVEAWGSEKLPAWGSEKSLVEAWGSEKLLA
jgi:hypothetical protein